MEFEVIRFWVSYCKQSAFYHSLNARIWIKVKTPLLSLPPALREQEYIWWFFSHIPIFILKICDYFNLYPISTFQISSTANQMIPACSCEHLPYSPSHILDHHGITWIFQNENWKSLLQIHCSVVFHSAWDFGLRVCLLMLFQVKQKVVMKKKIKYTMCNHI